MSTTVRLYFVGAGPADRRPSPASTPVPASSNCSRFVESKYDSAFGASNNRELVTTGQIDRRPASRQPCPAFGRISDCRVTQLQSRPRPPLPPPKPPSLVKEFPQCPSSATGHDTVSSVFDAESSIAPRLRSPPLFGTSAADPPVPRCRRDFSLDSLRSTRPVILAERASSQNAVSGSGSGSGTGIEIRALTTVCQMYHERQPNIVAAAAAAAAAAATPPMPQPNSGYRVPTSPYHSSHRSIRPNFAKPATAMATATATAAATTTTDSKLASSFRRSFGRQSTSSAVSVPTPSFQREVLRSSYSPEPKAIRPPCGFRTAPVEKRRIEPSYLIPIRSEQIEQLLKKPYYDENLNSVRTAPPPPKKPAASGVAEKPLPLNERNLALWSSLPENKTVNGQLLRKWHDSINIPCSPNGTLSSSYDVSQMSQVMSPRCTTPSGASTKSSSEYRQLYEQQRLARKEVSEEVKQIRRNKYKAKIDRAKREYLASKASVSDLYKTPQEFEAKFKMPIEKIRPTAAPRGPYLQYLSKSGNLQIAVEDVKPNYVLPKPKHDQEYEIIVKQAERLWGPYKKRHASSAKAKLYAQSRAISTGYLETELKSDSSEDDDIPEFEDGQSPPIRTCEQSRTLGASSANLEEGEFRRGSEHSRARSVDYLLDRCNREETEPPENQLKRILGDIKDDELSEQELRFRKSIEKLHMPDWYVNSDYVGRKAYFSGHSGLSSPEPLSAPTYERSPTSADRERETFYGERPNSAQGKFSYTRDTVQRCSTKSEIITSDRKRYEKHPLYATPTVASKSEQPIATVQSRAGKDIDSTKPYIPTHFFDKYKNEIEELRKSRSKLNEKQSQTDNSKRSFESAMAAFQQQSPVHQSNVSDSNRYGKRWTYGVIPSRSKSEQPMPMSRVQQTGDGSMAKPYIPTDFFDKYKYEIEELRRSRTKLNEKQPHQVEDSRRPFECAAAGFRQQSCLHHNGSVVPLGIVRPTKFYEQQPLNEPNSPPKAAMISSKSHSNNFDQTPETGTRANVPEYQSHPVWQKAPKPSIEQRVDNSLRQSVPIPDALEMSVKKMPGWTISTVPSDWNVPRKRNSIVVEVADTDLRLNEGSKDTYAAQESLEEVLDSFFFKPLRQKCLSVLDESFDSGASSSCKDFSSASAFSQTQIYSENAGLMRKCLENPHYARKLLETETLWVRCASCGRTQELRDGNCSYLTCENCYTYYCGDGCRQFDWPQHVLKCTFARVNTLCKEVIKKVRGDIEAQRQMSRTARESYLARGRGSVNFRFESMDEARKYISLGWLSVNRKPDKLHYYTVQELTELGKDPYVVAACRQYDTLTKFILSVSIMVDIEKPLYNAYV